ncbi:MAG: ABC transporter ATP-binding protein [Thermoplasmata archaeon]
MASGRSARPIPSSEPSPGVTALRVESLRAGYERMDVLHDVSLEIPEGKFTALVGPNSAGKTTLLRAMTGLIPTLGGTTYLGEHKLTGRAPESIVAAGISLVPEGRHVFPNMTVRDNLSLGAYLPPARARFRETYETVCALFPILKERARQSAKTLSGGEAQMLAIGRALMARPRVLMVDEPSLGLAPQVVAQVFQTLRSLTEHGVTVFAAEQNVRQILRLADRAYVLAQGRIVNQGVARELLDHPDIRKAFLGM